MNVYRPKEFCYIKYPVLTVLIFNDSSPNVLDVKFFLTKMAKEKIDEAALYPYFL